MKTRSHFEIYNTQTNINKSHTKANISQTYVKNVNKVGSNYQKNKGDNTHLSNDKGP